MDQSPKIIFWGTASFAIPVLESLLKNNYEIVGVVTAPDGPKGKNQTSIVSPVKMFAEKNSLKIFQPEVLSSKTELPKADLFIVAAYGKILPVDLLGIPRFGILNIHPSLLPRWRGPSPVQYTILNGDTETRVTIMKIDEKMDHGPIVATSNQEKITDKTTYKELQDLLFQEGAQLLIEILPKYLAGKIKPIPQDETKATYSKILTRGDGHIDWSKSAEEIDRMVRALNPWPGTWTITNFKNVDRRLVIEKAENISEEHSSRKKGLVWQSKPGVLYVQTGKGSLLVLKLTLEGKKSVVAIDFLRGHKEILGKILK